MKKNLLSVVMPVFNEEKTIENIIKRLSEVKLSEEWSFELIIVSDGSFDKTNEILEKYKDIYSIIFREKNGGKGAALRDGFKQAKGDYIIIQDADLEYDPNDYIKLLDPIIKGQNDIVFGSRILGKNNVSYSRVYFFGGVFLGRIFNLFFKTKLTDFATCYKVFHRKYLNDIMKYNSDDFVFDVAEITYSLSSQGIIKEVPISYNPRSNNDGKKLNVKHGIRIFFSLLKLFLRKFK